MNYGQIFVILGSLLGGDSILSYIYHINPEQQFWQGTGSVLGIAAIIGGLFLWMMVRNDEEAWERMRHSSSIS